MFVIVLQIAVVLHNAFIVLLFETIYCTVHILWILLLANITLYISHLFF